MENENKTLHPGDVLMDSTTFEEAFRAICWGVNLPQGENCLRGLAQLLRALILHERILIEPSSYDAHMQGGLHRYLDDMHLHDLVEPIGLDETELEKLGWLASKRSREIVDDLPTEVAESLVKRASLDADTRHEAARIVHYRELRRPYNPTTADSISAAVQVAAYRAYLYFAISCYKGVPYLPNAYRAAIIDHEVRTAFHYKNVGDAAMKAVEEAAEATAERRNRLIGQSMFNLEFPLILSYVLARVKRNWNEVIPCALELRRSSEARAFRKLCTKVDQATRAGDLDPLAEALDELSLRSKAWLNNLEEPSIDISIAFPLSIEFNPIGLWKHIKAGRKRHLIFLDKLYTESGRLSSLWPKIVALDTPHSVRK